MIAGMIFAAGLGTRLRPVTDSIPKAMVEVCGIPMLRRVIDRMAAAGVERIVVNVHHFPDVIIDYLTAERDAFTPEVIVSDERDRLLDTGGGLRRASPCFAGAEAVVIHNADILCTAPLDDLISDHLSCGADATLYIDPRRESSRRLLFDEGMRLHGRINLNTGETTPVGLDCLLYEKAAFGGIHVVGMNLLKALHDRYRPGEKFSITDFYCDEGSSLDIRGHVAPEGAAWFDIGRPQSLAAARAYLTSCIMAST